MQVGAEVVASSLPWEYCFLYALGGSKRSSLTGGSAKGIAL